VISPLIERAARRASQADAVLKTDETTILDVVGGELVRATTSTSQGTNLRVVVEGRAGVAGSVGDDPEELLQRAITSAALGEPTVLSLPFQTTLPAVVTHMPRASAATISELANFCHLVRDRLSAERADLRMVLERSVGSVRVANTRGVDASYDVSLVSLQVEACRVRDGRRIAIEARLCGADLPALTDLEQLVAMLRQRLAWAERDATAPSGRQRVLFLPSALPALLLPVEQGLAGKTALGGDSSLARRRGMRAYSEVVTLSDDPLVDGRPGSRPIDDEGVPSRMLTLVRAGQVEGLIYDLETASRVGATPTGHGRRSTFGKPQPACTNLVLESGSSSWEELLRAVGDGVVLERISQPQPSQVAGGTFALPAALAWGVAEGVITGLLPELTIAGNAHDLLNRVVALGRDCLWVGSRCAPALVVDGASVF
jgi:PmbA protein